MEAVLRALFSLPESGDRENLRRMVREYIEGPGRPTLVDGFSKSENTFAFANAKRAHFQRYWRAAIDRISPGLVIVGGRAVLWYGTFRRVQRLGSFYPDVRRDLRRLRGIPHAGTWPALYGLFRVSPAALQEAIANIDK